MRSRRSSRFRLAGRVLLASLCLSWVAVPLEAEPPTPPPYYAIRNVRVVTGTGATLEGATVLLANGLIEAVGRNVRIPGDARVIDGDSLTLYPGLIDALTTLAQKEVPKSDEGRAARGPVISGPADRPETTPWVSAVENLAEDAKIETWRKAGFTAAVTTPEKGIFAGQAALVNLVDRPDRQAVVATPVAHRVNFSGNGGFRSFPGSLMGVLSYIKQVFLDADHYAQVRATYAKDPRGRVRPEYDRTLEPLAAAIAEKTRFLLPANLDREIDRVLALRAELGVEGVLYGGQGAYARADALRGASVPVLVNLNWPKEEKDRDPDADTPLRTLVHRRLAPTTPAALAAAGVPFAFYSGGLASSAEIFEGVRKATENGLSNEDALAAFTSRAATILGVSDRVGTIDKGKIANVVLATDWPWAEGAEVRAVFVDGRLYRVHKDDKPAEKKAADEKDVAKKDETPKDGAADVPLDELRAALDVYQGVAKKMGTFAITNAQVWTVSGETIAKGTVVVSGGKIRAVGSDVTIPRGAEVIDAGGGALIPGIIDAHSHIAIEGGVNEGTLNVTAMVEVGDVVNADDIAIYRALAGGVTSANLLHGSANPIGGQNQVIKLRWGSDAEGLKFRGAPAGIKFALGENPKRSNFTAAGVPPRYPRTRMGVMDVIRDAFTAAQEYRKEWADYGAGARNGIKPALPRRDLALEALVEIIESRRMVHSHCYRADEILQLLRLAEEFGFRVATLQHVLEGYKVADEIAAHGAGASTFSDWWGYKVEAYEAIPHNAALMTERGVLVSINSDSGEEMRHLNQEAAKAVKWGGMSEVDALKLVTLNPARQLGIDDRVGSIEVGKDADLVLYDGPPLSMFSVVQKTFIDGDLYFDAETDRSRQTAIDALKERLASKGKGGDDEDKHGTPGGAARSAPSPEVRWADEPYSCGEDHR